ncbi:MAG: DUF4013 domain-containing protein [Verrucomicrobia bacterium]|nr:DUF4013 domain-containing protein [Verrucomicrobiota bacterium]MDA1066732.1 DUF4013 domain-containing protein [Verrucomicrobiota bacterium]
MVSVEQVWRKVFKTSGCWPKLLIGSLVMLIPVVNIFALGYLYRTTALVKSGAPFIYSDWDRWKDLFIDGLKFLVLAIVWLGIPMFIGFFVSIMVGVVSHELGQIAFMISVPIGIQLFSSSLYRYQNFESFKDAMDLPLLLKVYMRTVSYGLLPLLGYCGILWILGSLSVLVLFIISLVILVYFTSLYRAIEYGNM